LELLELAELVEIDLPLMILQKMHDAILLAIGLSQVSRCWRQVFEKSIGNGVSQSFRQRDAQH
jgi:hypothetical protein